MSKKNASQRCLWALLKDNPDAYLYPAVRHGVIDENGDEKPLPKKIADGIKDVKKRGDWNKAADAEFALPTETWREHVARRQRCLEIREKLIAGEVTEINDLITYNLNIRQFAQDVIHDCEGSDLLKAFWNAIRKVTVLDPTCGSGAFLFAALDILKSLYETCLDRMQGFIEDANRAGESTKKFKLFRETLSEIDQHPNLDYFILKSIIVNNLYGVDIMEEAVEICKLRMFLKLVSQIEKVDNLQPLPDIDFNVRAGNTLVGYASVTQLKESLKGTLGFEKGEVDRILEEAEVCQKAFKRFQDMQTSYGYLALDFYESKTELRTRLTALGDRLNHFLHGEYEGVCKDFGEWKKKYEPFHWCIDFFGITSSGGFDVVIGNPPYVEYHKVRKTYSLNGYSTIKCGNLYAYVLERCFSITRPRGRIGMIVQLSAICTSRMHPLQKAYLKESSAIWCSCYDDRPGKLFDGLEHIRAAIILNEQKRAKSHASATVYSTRLQRWYTESRGSLFDLTQYGEISNYVVDGSFPKIGDNELLALVDSLTSNQITLNYAYDPSSAIIVHYYRSPLYWIRSMDFLPYFKSKTAKRSVHHYKDFQLKSQSLIPVVGATINSSLFYLWFIVFGNGRNVAIRDITTLPAPKKLLESKAAKTLKKRFTTLMESYQNNSIRRKRKDGVEYQEFYPAKSKDEMDSIDLELSKLYGLTEEQTDYVINYDIKYRLGIEEDE